LVRIGDGEYDEINSYNELSNIVGEQYGRHMETSDTLWVFKGIKSHQGPLSSARKYYEGSSCNVLVEWEVGSEAYHLLEIIIKYDPASVANHDPENNL
jgi:hypothetical protein